MLNILGDHSLNLHDKSVKIQELLLKNINGDEILGDIQNAFKFFDFTKNQVVFLPNNTNIARITDPLSNTRSTVRGLLSFESGYEFNVSDLTHPISVAHALRNPMSVCSEILMIKENADQYGLVNGMPLVLYSYNKKYRNTEDLINAFKAQRTDDSLRKDVYYAYTYTPKYSLTDYIQNVHDIICGTSSSNFRIGNKFSSFKVLYDLYKNDPIGWYHGLKNLLDKSNIVKYKVSNRGSLTRKVQQNNTTINGLDDG